MKDKKTKKTKLTQQDAVETHPLIKAEKGISAGFMSTEEEEANIEEEKKEERPKEETKPEESESDDTSRRTPEEKQQQYEEAYGMSEKKQAEAELQRKTPLVIRESLVNFVIEQEMLLRTHDPLKGADGWLDAHPLVLVAKLMSEVGELAQSILDGDSSSKVRREAADVGNLAMMIAHKSGKL